VRVGWYNFNMSQPTATRTSREKQSVNRTNQGGGVALLESSDHDPSGVAEVAGAGSVVLSMEDLQEIGGYLGRNIQDRRGLLIAAEKVTGISVDGVSVYLEPMLLSRLKSRCVRREFKVFVQEVVIEKLREYAGL
jgi:hypothetical protein